MQRLEDRIIGGDQPQRQHFRDSGPDYFVRPEEVRRSAGAAETPVSEGFGDSFSEDGSRGTEPVGIVGADVVDGEIRRGRNHQQPEGT